MREMKKKRKKGRVSGTWTGQKRKEDRKRGFEITRNHPYSFEFRFGENLNSTELKQ